jgi:eukaryotic-like serine/threonine-protein kinase
VVGVTARARVHAKQVNVPRVRLVEISGVIDETFTPEPIFESLAAEGDPIVIDLGGVRRITSVGVRNWRQSLRMLADVDYFFINCRPAMVWQFNMIVQFGGRGRLLSMFLPYTCSSQPDEHDESEHLLDLRRDHELVLLETPPPQRCAVCGASAEFDEDPSSYFGYASQQPPPVVPTMVAALLDDSSKTTPTALKIRKDVTRDLTAVWLAGTIPDNARFKRIAKGLDGPVLVVAQDIQEISAQGLAKLVDALTAESSHVFLARIPTPVARVIAQSANNSHPPYVSLWIGLQCETCNEVAWQDFDQARWTALSRDGNLPSCLTCAGMLVPFAEHALDQLELAPMPPVVARYLSTHASFDSAPVSAVVDPPRRQRRPSIAILQLEGYEIVHRLGIGGMAEVLLARQVGVQGFNKLVALKRILPALAHDQVFVDMFLREARIAATISHPNVVQIFDLKQSAADFYIVMEYVPGWNLDLVIKTANRAAKQMPLEFACRIVSDACAGLHAAHTATNEQGKSLVVVHRDVSPHNILVSKTGQVKLTDFGIAKATNTTAITKTDGLKGKFMYMAPERFESIDSDVRSDVFAVGLTLFYCLTHTHPFQGPTELTSWENAVRSIVPPPSSLRSDVPPSLDAIVARAVARDPNDRYQTAEDLQLALDQFMLARGTLSSQLHVARWVNELFTANEARADLDSVGMNPTAPGFLRPQR